MLFFVGSQARYSHLIYPCLSVSLSLLFFQVIYRFDLHLCWSDEQCVCLFLIQWHSMESNRTTNSFSSTLFFCWFNISDADVGVIFISLRFLLSLCLLLVLFRSTHRLYLHRKGTDNKEKTPSVPSGRTSKTPKGGGTKEKENKR